MAETSIPISALPKADAAGNDDVLVINRKADGTHQIALKDVQIGTEYSLTLTASGWAGSAAPYTQTVSVTGLSSEKRYSLVSAFSADLSSSVSSKAYAKAYSMVSSGYATVADGLVTFTVYKKPAVDLPVKLIG